MIRGGISFSFGNALILGFALLACPLAATAQRHGGGITGGSGLSGNSRPTGVKEDDTLKDFHQAMAVQATSQQTAEFQAAIKITEDAKTQLQVFLDRLQKPDRSAEAVAREPVDQALENARSANKKFQQGFSPAQKSGLRDIAKRLAKVDSDLDQEEKKLDQSLVLKAASSEVAARAESLGKALTDFYNQQLALGREMSITLANGQDLAFNLPSASHPVRIANQTIAIPVSGELNQISAQGGQRTFKLELTANLTDLQQNITELLRSQLDTSDNCGQRIAIQQATLAPSTPTGLLVVKLHFERWTCSQMFGKQTSNELAEGDGTVEIKLTASVEKPGTSAGTLKIVPAFGRIDATGMMGEALRSGSLGENLRNVAAQSVLTAAQTGSDFKTTLPPAVQNSAVLQTARFQDTGVGTLTLLLDGQLEISNEQADALASQLNQALSAQGPPPR
jgi:hypothetical protein